MVNASRLAASFALGALVAGCTAVLGIDKDYHAAEDGGVTGSTGTAVGGSGPGSGGASTGSAGAAGGSSTTTGSGGAGCPSGTQGPTMVDLGTFCIDGTEVTNTHYAKFLAANVPPQSISKMPAACTWNTSYAPLAGTPPNDDKPVTGVDWCDAYAYCAWAGKHLCGKVDGGSAFYNAYTNPGSDAWFAACSMGGAVTYPYGNTYAGTTCNGRDFGANTPLNVGEAANCKGTMSPYDQIFDMSGNAGEWEDSCNAATGNTDTCRVRGGSYLTANTMALECAANTIATRSQQAAEVGFRCCSP